MTAPNTGSEPVLYEVIVDMTTTGERELIKPGERVYTLFIASLGAGTTGFQIEINGRFISFKEGDNVDFGDCYPSTRGMKVRTTPALPGIFSVVVVGGTPSSILRA